MSTETITIGCRLPNGLTIEVGYTTTQRGAGGTPYVAYIKGADYQKFTLKGTNQHLHIRGPNGKVLATLPSARDREPYINVGVPKDLWDRWSKEHQDSWLLKSGQLFVVPKPADTKAVVADAKATSSAIFEPLDPSKPFRVAGNEVSKRIDDDL